MPTAAAAFSIGTAKPMPMNTRCSVGLRIAGHDADHLAVRVTSGPPELPGLAAASNWIRLVSTRLPSGERNSRLSPETTPADTDGPMPNGKPTATTSSPGRRSLRRAQRRRGEVVGDLLRLQHREIVLGLHADDDGRLRFEAVGERHLHALRAGHDVQVGEDDALVDDHDAGADAALDVAVAVGVVGQPRTRTTDGRTASAARDAAEGRVLVLERVKHRGVDVLLRDRLRSRATPADHQREQCRNRRARGDEQQAFHAPGKLPAGLPGRWRRRR